MKALIISNDDFIVSQSGKALKEIGCDLIIYRWLLKALDNIEEIHPDVVFISASEYPRHWKTLVQFLKSGIGGDKVAVYLYESAPLSEDDLEKAKALGINGYVRSFSDDEIDAFCESVLNFFNINKDETKDAAEKAKETDEMHDNNDFITEDKGDVITVEDLLSIPKKENIGFILFTNPETQIINTGKVVSFNHNKLECQFDFELTELENNDQIAFVSYFDDTQCFSFSAEIFILNREENKAVLTIQKRYEEI